MPIKQAYQEFLDETKRICIKDKDWMCKPYFVKYLKAWWNRNGLYFYMNRRKTRVMDFTVVLSITCKVVLKLRFQEIDAVSFIHWRWKSSNKIAPVWINWHYPYITKVFPIVASVLFLRICFPPIIVLGSYRNGSKHLCRYDYPGNDVYFHHTITLF